jgi:hypothetical protein
VGLSGAKPDAMAAGGKSFAEQVFSSSFSVCRNSLLPSGFSATSLTPKAFPAP